MLVFAVGDRRGDNVLFISAISQEIPEAMYLRRRTIDGFARLARHS